MKAYLIPFAAAFIVFLGAFIAFDAVLMNMQGLSLLFHQ